VKHITSACPILAKEKYIKRHDRVCAQLHFNICKEIGVKLHNKHQHENVRKLDETSHEGKVTILWNQKVRSNWYILNNKLDNIIRDSNKGTCTLIDVALLGDRKIIKKEAEKIYKYIELILEIQSKWNVKAKVLPLTIWATAPLQNHSHNTWVT